MGCAGPAPPSLLAARHLLLPAGAPPGQAPYRCLRFCAAKTPSPRRLSAWSPVTVLYDPAGAEPGLPTASGDLYRGAFQLNRDLPDPLDGKGAPRPTVDGQPLSL